MNLRLPAVLLLSASATVSAQTGNQIFTTVTPTSVILLQWTEAGGQLKGTAQAVSVRPSAQGINLTVINSGLSGTHAGADYSLNFDKFILGDGIASAPATVNKGNLLISIPLESGGLGTLTLLKSSLPKFNDAVSALKAAAQKKVAAAQAAAAVQSGQGKVDQALADLRQLVPAQEQGLAALQPLMAKATTIGSSLPMQVKAIDAAFGQQACRQVDDLINQYAVSRSEVDEVLNPLAETAASLKESAQKIQSTVLAYQAGLGELQRQLPAKDSQALLARNAPVIARANQVLSATGTRPDQATVLVTTVLKQVALSDAEVGSIVCPQQ